MTGKELLVSLHYVITKETETQLYFESKTEEAKNVEHIHFDLKNHKVSTFVITPSKNRNAKVLTAPEAKAIAMICTELGWE